MNNLEKLKAICSIIEDEIDEKIIDKNGDNQPIIDGIINQELYLKTEPKILWILKEAYDENGGGWNYAEEFLGKDDFFSRIGRANKTWYPILYISYGIINGFIEYEDMDWLWAKPEMVFAIKQIAVINVKKLPGETRTRDFNQIISSYNEYKDILLKQIKGYDPDIIIGGSTMHLFYKDLGISEGDIIKNDSIDYAVKDKKLYIAAYHPAQTKFKQEKYVNDIINVSCYFWKEKR